MNRSDQLIKDFKIHKADLMRATMHTGERQDMLKIDAIFAIGVLLGGGFPGSAAAFAVLIEGYFPDYDFPWKTLGGE